MSDFYTDLRDNDAQPLIKEYGQQATYTSVTNTTDEYESGDDYMSFTATTEEVQVWLLDLPVRSSREESGREFEAESVERAKAKFLLSATEFANANVTPKTGDRIVLNTNQNFRVLAINPVAPAGIPVIYKMLVGD